jgi:hypothetical protein
LAGKGIDYSAWPGLRFLRCALLLRCQRDATPHAVLLPHFFHSLPKDCAMTFTLSIGPLVSLLAGILILVMPRLLSTIVAIYLIIMGILGLLGMHSLKF